MELQLHRKIFYVYLLKPVDINHSLLETYSVQLRVKSAFVVVKINKDLTGGNLSTLELCSVEVTNSFVAM